jgi:hypothetical protein
MTTREKLFPSKWLKCTDIPEAGLVATITSVDQEMVGDEEESKPVVSFKETAKGLVLNVTNFDLIAAWHGGDTIGWIGKRVTLYRTVTTYKGKPVNAIRIVAKQPKMPAPPPEVEGLVPPEEYAPF